MFDIFLSNIYSKLTLACHYEGILTLYIFLDISKIQIIIIINLYIKYLIFSNVFLLIIYHCSYHVLFVCCYYFIIIIKTFHFRWNNMVLFL